MLTVLVVLLAVHFLNVFLHWTVIRLELAQAPVFNSPEYSFFGFSLFNQEKISSVRYFEKSSQPARVFAYFDIFHPAVFDVWNRKNDMAFVDFGPVILSLPPGFSRVALYPGPGFFVEHENRIALKSYAASYGGSSWYRFLSAKFLASRKKPKELRNVSFVVKELETSQYLKIPYLLYFFLPLLIVVLLAMRHGAAYLTALIYYVEMFFLFDFRSMFVSVPFHWFLKLVHWEIGAAQVELVAMVLVTVFVLASAVGLWNWKKNTLAGLDKGIILFFVLLPFFLFL